MQTLDGQTVFETQYNDELWMVGTGMVVIGMILVVTSFWQLGWFGTWHGE